MNTSFLKQAEVFVFISIAFLLIALKFNKEYMDNPPIIILSEDDVSYRFESGSAVISQEFSNQIKDKIIPKIDSLSKKYNCNAIQIIGHTSGKPLNHNYRSNIDRQILYYLYDRNIDLIPNSNTDLGMMRSIAILKLIKSAKNNNMLENIKMWFAYSAGHTINTNNELVPQNEIKKDLMWDDPKRRRIEIRLFKHR